MDILSLVKEFYVLEVVEILLKEKDSNFEPFKHSHEKWANDYYEFRSDFHKKFARALFDYTVVVVAGELRHCYPHASLALKDYPTSSEYHRDDVYLKCIKYNPIDILKAGKYLFDPEKVSWSSSFGGEKWFDIAKAGLLYEALPDVAFIDHCIDLSHNCSIYFDKGAGIFNLNDNKEYVEFLSLKRYCGPSDLFRECIVGKILNGLLMRAFNLGILDGKYVGPASTYSFLREDRDNNYLIRKADNAESILMDRIPIHWGMNPLNLKLKKGKYRRYEDEDEERESEHEE